MTEAVKQIDIDDMLSRAREHLRAQEFDAARALGLKAVEAEPGNVEAINLIGLIAQGKGDLKEAIVWMTRAADTNPDVPAYQSNLCEVYRQAGEFESAIAAGRQAVAIAPDHVPSLINLGLALVDVRDFGAAEAQFRQVIAVAPDLPEAYLNLAKALEGLDRKSEAIEACRRALALRELYPEAYDRLAMLLIDAGQLKAAEKLLHRAIGLLSKAPVLHYRLALTLLRQQRLEEALEAARQVLKLAPKHFLALALAGRVSIELGDLEAGRDYCSRAVALKPMAPGVLNNLSVACLELGDIKGASECLLRLIALEPGNARLHMRRAMIRMLMGDIDGGLAEYEWRLKIPDERPPHLPKLRPVNLPGQMWNGEPLEGKRLFIWCEQGLGDTIHCMRFLPELMARKPAVLFGQIPPKLHPLAQLNYPWLQLVPVGSEPPEADYHVEMMSLLRIVGRSEAWKETGEPYLKVPADQYARFQTMFEPYSGLKIGVVWAGNSNHMDDKNRSMPGEFLLPLLKQPGCHFFSLQVGDKADDRRLFEAGLIDFAGEVNNMTATAAAIAALDLVIAVDTSLAHVAGAVGTPVMTLLSLVPDWRWGTDGVRTELYNSMRLIRQEKRKDWAGVIEKVSAALSVKTGAM